MDTMQAYLKAQAATARGARLRVFDWHKAARIIRERKPRESGAGLSSDWEWTGGTIYRDGQPVTDDHTYLASVWATPELTLDDETVDCWVYADESPGWDCYTKWPASALAILNGESVK